MLLFVRLVLRIPAGTPGHRNGDSVESWTLRDPVVGRSSSLLSVCIGESADAPGASTRPGRGITHGYGNRFVRWALRRRAVVAGSGTQDTAAVKPPIETTQFPLPSSSPSGSG